MATFKNFAYLIVGVFVGAISCAIVRVAQYKLNGLQPNMAPEMFILFAPVLALPIALVALIAHFAMRASFTYRRDSHWFLAGVAYASVLLLLVTPWLLPLAILACFLVIRKIQRVI
jgi:hypothetical protein